MPSLRRLLLFLLALLGEASRFNRNAMRTLARFTFDIVVSGPCHTFTEILDANSDQSFIMLFNDKPSPSPPRRIGQYWVLPRSLYKVSVRF